MGYSFGPAAGALAVVGVLFLFMLGFVVARRASSPGVIGRVYANDANVGPWCGPAVVGRGFHGGARGLQRPPRVLRVPPSLKRNPSGRHPGKDTQMGDDASDDGSGDVPFHLNDMDKWVLSQTDDTFKCHTWDDLRQIIQTNQLALLTRKPSDLRRYIKWSADTKAKYGSTTNYLLTRRLPRAWGQPPFTPASATPFADQSDYCVLINHWPYGLAPGITHLVVWSRALIAADDTVGDMTPESRKTVADFIKRFFENSLGPGTEDRVLWFKNWVALQSVRTVDHVHVLVRDVDPAVIRTWTREYREERG